mgnify:CR=1 FL=1
MCQAITALLRTRTRNVTTIGASTLWDGSVIDPQLPVADPATWKT